MGPACGDSLPALIVVISGGHSETSWGRMQEACVLPQSCESWHSSLEWRESVGGVFGGICEKCDALCSGWEQACQPERQICVSLVSIGGCSQFRQPGQVAPALQLLTLRTECKHG